MKKITTITTEKGSVTINRKGKMAFATIYGGIYDKDGNLIEGRDKASGVCIHIPTYGEIIGHHCAVCGADLPAPKTKKGKKGGKTASS